MAVRRGTCPVYTERHRRRDPDAKPAPHLMLRAGHEQGFSVTGKTDHPFEGNYARCTGCGYEERDYHYCDFVLQRYQDRRSHWSCCDSKARNYVEELPSEGSRGVKSGRFWVCDKHTADKVAARKAERDRKEHERYDAQTARLRYGWVGKSYEGLLVELSDWLTKNLDLVESDEWLKSIVRKLDADSSLKDALERKFGHRFILSHDAGGETDGAM